MTRDFEIVLTGEVSNVTTIEEFHAIVVKVREFLDKDHRVNVHTSRAKLSKQDSDLSCPDCLDAEWGSSKGVVE